VELAPALLPAVRDLAQHRFGKDGGHRVRGVAVGGQLEAAGGVALLEAVRGQLAEAGAQLLGTGGGSADRGPDQRKALFSFSKKLGSAS
jgi:hypothetical protein